MLGKHLRIKPGDCINPVTRDVEGLKSLTPLKKYLYSHRKSTTTRKAGGLDFTAIGGKRQGREVPQSLRVEPGASHPV
jgi:hypothetical protein